VLVSFLETFTMTNIHTISSSVTAFLDLLSQAMQ